MCITRLASFVQFAERFRAGGFVILRIFSDVENFF